MNHSFEKNLFDIEIEEEQEEERIRTEEMQRRKQEEERLRSIFEAEKSLAVEELEKGLHERQRDELLKEFESKKSPFRKEYHSSNQRFHHIMWTKFVAEKFLDEHQYSFNAYLVHIGFNQK